DVGGDHDVVHAPQRMAVGEGLGVGDVEPRAADRAVAQRGDEIVGDDVAAAGDVDDPCVVGEQVEPAAVDQALGLGREGEGEHDGVGTVEGGVEAVQGDDPAGAGHGQPTPA